MPAERPGISVIVPTFNRCEHLAATLASLAAQTLPRDRFEVIVCDDGSTDDTYEVCLRFRDELRLRYRYQEDLGFRAAAARNGGARVAAAEVLLFLDTGTLAGPDLLAGHLAAHEAAPPAGLAVAGYTYCYHPYGSPPGLAGLLEAHSPAEVVRRHGEDAAFQDWRHDELVRLGFDLGRHGLPWIMFWSMNCSVSAREFWRAGGFCESFDRWGVEDMEFGFRLVRGGVPLAFSRRAWALESPHPRDAEGNAASNRLNLAKLLDLHREPLIELTWAVFTQDEIWPLETDHRELVEWTARARGLRVRDELERAAEELRDVPPGRIAVFGCGDDVPAALAGAVLFDFDEEVVGRLNASGLEARAAIGLRVALPAESMAAVVVTSRLSGLADRWAGRIAEEARRVGGRLWTASGRAPGPVAGAVAGAVAGVVDTHGTHGGQV
ncbi:glycosyltransferase [Streptomyces sp. NPDC012623]|uniref:glycosyltransferase n=1 Tax=unclassified Streptomyces TaxID=2593676 RepID=UPI003689E9C1